ncbi:hypothetical protein ACFV5J_00320 [Streptomyces zaomyceticus]|uniref:hypothetical protein n=1 Tax=Streptomyces zaomyceticus TaxID=68286 RepID=UPI003653C8A1
MTLFTVWKIADKKQDALDLAAFKCAIKHPPNNRAFPWEGEVEKYFHREVWADTNASSHLGQRFRIADDGEGIAAAYTHARMADQPGFTPPAGEQTRLLVMLGIALRHRGKGGEFADEVLLDALYDILDAEPESAKINVLAKVHMHNAPSQKMLTRAGFQQNTAGTPTKPLGWWSLTLGR